LEVKDVKKNVLFDKRKTFLGGGEGNPFFLGINRRWFEHTAKRLRMRKYPFKPTRQVNIPKPGKPKETLSSEGRAKKYFIGAFLLCIFLVCR